MLLNYYILMSWFSPNDQLNPKAEIQFFILPISNQEFLLFNNTTGLIELNYNFYRALSSYSY